LILHSREFDDTQFVPDNCPYYEMFRKEKEREIRWRHELDHRPEENE
jgi:hypothetical protein